MISKELQKKALRLNPLERIQLVEVILKSLDKPDPEIEKAWVAESEVRYAAYKTGKIKAVSLNSVQKRLKKIKS